jgi:hypothetical protein
VIPLKTVAVISILIKVNIDCEILLNRLTDCMLLQVRSNISVSISNVEFYKVPISPNPNPLVILLGTTILFDWAITKLQLIIL